MVLITHCGDNQDKLNRILQAAQARFGMYGLEKTTMREIADDVSLSKAALYYYFKDKNELFHAVIEKEQNEYLNLLMITVEAMTNPSDKIRAYVKLRNDYMRKFMNLSKLRFDAFMAIKPLLADIFEKLRNRELEFLSNEFEQGHKQGIFNVENPYNTASLFFEIIISLRWRLHKKNYFVEPDSSEFKEIEDNLFQFVEIYLRGIEAR